jgi:hypothetical protein
MLLLSRYRRHVGNSATGCKALRPNTCHTNRPPKYQRYDVGAYLKRDCSTAPLLQASSPIDAHHTRAISTSRVVTDGPALVVPVDVLSDLAFQLDLQARCPKVFIAHGTRSSLGLDQRLLEMLAVRIQEHWIKCRDKRTALLATGAKATLHSQARQRTTNGAASL